MGSSSLFFRREQKHCCHFENESNNKCDRSLLWHLWARNLQNMISWMNALILAHGSSYMKFPMLRRLCSYCWHLNRLYRNVVSVPAYAIGGELLKSQPFFLATNASLHSMNICHSCPHTEISFDIPPNTVRHCSPCVHLKIKNKLQWMQTTDIKSLVVTYRVFRQCVLFQSLRFFPNNCSDYRMAPNLLCCGCIPSIGHEIDQPHLSCVFAKSFQLRIHRPWLNVVNML